MKKDKVFAKDQNRKLKKRIRQEEDKKIDFPYVDTWI